MEASDLGVRNFNNKILSKCLGPTLIHLEFAHGAQVFETSVSLDRGEEIRIFVHFHNRESFLQFVHGVQ